MGLDANEIVMEVEDHFGITIADDEAADVRTVGDLVALIRGRFVATASPQCLALPAFLSLRALIREVAGDPTLRVKPSDGIVGCLSPKQRRRLWRRLPELLGTAPPPLRRARPVRVALACVSVALVVAAVAVVAIDLVFLPFTLLTALVLVVLLYLMTAWLCNVPPDSLTTLGDITLKIVGRSATVKQHDLPDDQSVLAELKPIIAEQLGIDSEEVVLSANFVEDLGL